MKATGIVRRIDDLGRVVIPKEIRRTMRIREGDPLEIYTSRDGEVIFKKYSLLGGVEDFAGQLCETMSRSTGCICAVPVCDGSDKLVTSVAAPILSEGDLLGMVLFVGSAPGAATGDAEYKLAQTIAAFLGRHMEA